MKNNEGGDKYEPTQYIYAHHSFKQVVVFSWGASSIFYWSIWFHSVFVFLPMELPPTF